MRFEPALRAGPRGDEGAIACSIPSTACSTGRSSARASWSGCPAAFVRRATATRSSRSPTASGSAVAALALAGIVAGRRAPAVGAAVAGSVPARAGRDLHRSSSPSRATACPIELLAFPFVAFALARDRGRRARRRVPFAAPASCRRAQALGPALVLRRRLARGLAGDARQPARRCARAIAGRSRSRRWTGAGACCSGRPRRRSPPGRRWRERRNGVHIVRRRRRRSSDAAPPALGGGPLPAGRYAVHFRLEAPEGCPLRPRGQGAGGRRPPRPPRSTPKSIIRVDRSSCPPQLMVRRRDPSGSALRRSRLCPDVGATTGQSRSAEMTSITGKNGSPHHGARSC